MTTGIVDSGTLWAVLAMEAALAFPIMSLPTQGDRLPGLLGPLLLLLLLPGGFAAVSGVRSLREPSWRLLTGIGLALLTRAIVSDIPGEGMPGLLTWLAHSVVPVTIGVGLWWRGGALAVAELTPAEVRNEFSVIAVGLVVILALIRPFLLPDQLLLGASVGLFAIAGLVGTALSRQDAAGIASPRLSWPLAAVTGLIPAVVAVFLVGSLRPELLNSMWLLLARAIELALTPLGLLLAWIGSFLPHGTPGPPTPPPPLPSRPPIDTSALADAQAKLAWIGPVIVFTLIVAAGLALALAARLLLANFIRDPSTSRRAAQHDLDPDVEAIDREGTLGEDAADVLGWLKRWLSLRLSRKRRLSPNAGLRSHEASPRDAWAAYQRLLAWADTQGLARRQSETTGQLSVRLAEQRPDAGDFVDEVTRTFESERYGGLTTSTDRLQRARQALQSLVDR